MNRLVFFLVLIPFLLAGAPTIKNALRNQVVIDFKNAIVPIVSKHIENLVLPDVHKKSGGVKIDVTKIHAHITPIKPNQISIVFVPNSSIIRFSGSGFSLSGSAHIHAKWFIIGKSLDATVSVRNMGFAVQLTLLMNSGKPNIAVNSVSISLSAGNVSIKFRGGLINKILQFVANLLKGHFIKSIVSQLQSKMPPKITEVVNSKLNTLPSDIAITPTLSIKYGFPSAPYVKQDYLFTGIAGYVHPKNNPNPPPYPIAAMPEFDAANPKGIQFFISDYVIRSAIDATFTIGSMNVHLDKVLMNHHIKMTCSATKSPDFAFVNAIRVTMDVNCVVDFDDNVNNRFTLVTGLTIALKEYVRAAVIFFSMQEAKFNKLEYKQEKPVDIKWFKDGINKVLAAVIEIANSELGQKGIPLPTVKGIDYTDTVEFVKAGYMEICTNPIFKITTLEEEVADAFAN